MKKIKLLIAFLLLISTSNLWAALILTGGGDGTVGNPYKIATRADLNMVRTAVNAAIGAGDALAYYELAANIDMSGSEFTGTGIGSSGNPFKGTFDGKGFKITGLFVGNATTAVDQNTAGLFTFVNAATIKNLELSNVQFYVSKATTILAAGLIGTADGVTTIDNCKVSGTISANVTVVGQGTAQQAKIGGLICTVSNGGKISITNSSVDVQLIANVALISGVNCNPIVGGIIADAGVTAVNPIINIVNCFSTGSISNTTGRGNCYSGGILGNRTGLTTASKIYNCYSAMSIDGLSSDAAAGIQVGGICGITPTLVAGNTGTFEVKNCIALNPHIYARSAKATLTSFGRIAGNKSASITDFSSNYAYTGVDLKGWTSWTGTMAGGSGTAATVTIANSATDINGLTAENTVSNWSNSSSFSGAGTDAATILGAYVTANPLYPATTGTALNAWSTGTDANTTYTVPKFLTPTISFTTGTVNLTMQDATYTQTASSNSTAIITYSSSNPTVATINASTGVITFNTVGSTTITAAQSSGGTYACGTANYTLNISAITPTISFPNSNETIFKKVGDAAFIYTATSNSAGTIVYTSATPSVATVDASTGEITVTASQANVGTSVITATQAAQGNYSAATASFTVQVDLGTGISNTSLPSEITTINEKLVVNSIVPQVLEVYNIIGRKVFTRKISQGIIEINLPFKGIYLVKIGNKSFKVSI